VRDGKLDLAARDPRARLLAINQMRAEILVTQSQAARSVEPSLGRRSSDRVCENARAAAIGALA